MTVKEFAALVAVLELAKHYHDSPACKALSCTVWQECKCASAEHIQESTRFLMETFPRIHL